MLQALHDHSGETSQLSSPVLTKPLSPAIRNRGAHGSSKLKKAMSTPNVRGQASADAAALALSAEKRRNKLGYHRTSVACGHCRRRKIRCIPAPADPQNRCSNCIRLKKDCNFYPVDNPPPPDAGRRGSQAQSGTARTSESSSPSASTAHMPEMQANHPYPHLTIPSVQDLGGPESQLKRQRTESFSPEVKVVTSTRPYEYNQGHTNWMAPEVSPGSAKTQADAPQTYWRGNPQESPITPAFSPFTPNLHIPPVQNWPPTHAEPSPRDEMAWPPPVRSNSYGNIEGLQQHHHQYSQYPAPSQQHHAGADPYRPRMLNSGMYPPPPISTSGHSAASHATTGEPQHPQSAGTLPPVNYSQWQQPYYQKPVGSSSEPYGNWNSSHGPPHQPAHSQQQGYAYGEPTSGAYYPPPSHRGR